MKDLFEILPTEGSAVVIRDLRAQIAKLTAGETIAVFSGASHMAELAKLLRDELHDAPGTEPWKTAFTARHTRPVCPRCLSA